MRQGFGWVGLVGAIAVGAFTAGCTGASGGGTGSGEPVDVGTAVPESLADKGSVTIGVKCDFPPLGYIESDGRNAGYEISLAHGLAEYAFGDSEAVDFECVTAANRVPMLTNGRVDMLIATLGRTPEREEVMTFTESPHYLDGLSMLADGEVDIEGWDELDGRTAISLTGSTGSQVLNECFAGAAVQEYESASDSLTALSQGRGDVFVYDTTFFAGMLSNSDEYHLVGDSIAPTAAGIGMNRDDEEMASWVDAVLADMTERDLLWEYFTEWVEDEALLDTFADYIPRADAPLEYPEQLPWESCE